MKHGRGINLTPYDGDPEFDMATLASLPEWYVLFARCVHCGNQVAIDRWDVARRCGKGIALAEVCPRLKCNRCGNRIGNRLFLGKLPRD
nr:hypothetical protein [Rhizobium sp. BK376]